WHAHARRTRGVARTRRRTGTTLSRAHRGRSHGHRPGRIAPRSRARWGARLPIRVTCLSGGVVIVAFDVGNTETTIGLFDEEGALCAHWRLMTEVARSADEFGLLLDGLLRS